VLPKESVDFSGQNLACDHFLAHRAGRNAPKQHVFESFERGFARFQNVFRTHVALDGDTLDFVALVLEVWP
jgi:hypothetical protein